MIRGPLQTLPQATAASATALVASNAQHVELADQITEYGRAVAGQFSSSVARSSVAAGKWFLQRLDGEKPDVFCHATQLMQGADSLPVGQRVRFDLASNVRRAVTPLNAVDRMYVSRAGFSAKGQTQSSTTHSAKPVALALAFS
jgi:cold shock CspA family protein